MTKHRNKAGLVAAIQVEHRRLEKTLALVNWNDMVREGVVGNWSAKDVLAHLTAWEQLLLRWYDEGFHGKMSSPPVPTGMSRSSEDALNQKLFEQNRKRQLASVLSEFQTSYQQVLSTVQVIPEEDMFTPGSYAWTERLTLADYIAGNTCNHYLWAKTQIQKWLKRETTAGENLINLPEQLEKLVGGYTRNQVTIGESTAATWRLEQPGHPTLFLKIERNNPRRELTLSREVEVMSWLHGKLPVPEVIYYLENGDTDYLLMSAISGLNAVDIKGKVYNAELVRLLAQGLRMVHSVPVDDCPFDWSLDKSIKMAEYNLKHYLVDEEDFDEQRRGMTAAALMDELHRHRPPDEDLVFTHGDYCLPNIIIDKGRVSGFIDLSKAGISDRYQDIALALRSIEYNLGPGFDRIFLNEYGITEPDLKKMEYYKLLDEFF